MQRVCIPIVHAHIKFSLIYASYSQAISRWPAVLRLARHLRSTTAGYRRTYEIDLNEKAISLNMHTNSSETSWPQPSDLGGQSSDRFGNGGASFPLPPLSIPNSNCSSKSSNNNSNHDSNHSSSNNEIPSLLATPP